MAIDWTAVASLTGLATALITAMALVLETRRSRISLQTDAHLNLVERFDSPEMVRLRQTASLQLLAHDDTNFELYDILEFFSTLATLCNSQVVNTEVVFDEFSYWIIRYWKCAGTFISESRDDDPLSYAGLEYMVNRMLDEERKHGYTANLYSDRFLEAFLRFEARLPKKRPAPVIA